MKLTFVGQAPSRRTRDNQTWAPGLSTLALARLAGCDYATLTARADFRNLLSAFPGRRASNWGDVFDARAAAEAAARLSTELTGLAICLGRNVARAFGRGELPPLSIVALSDELSLALLPHPSGRNRWYNNPANRAAAARFLRDLFR